MQKSSVLWTKWAETIFRFKAESLVAWLLEVGEPLTLVGAQMLYFSQPLLGHDRIKDLARFLENKEEVSAFTAYLRKD